jgi:hypothetical protein
MFLRYKQLKKQLKQLKKHRADSTQDTASAEAAVQKQPAEEGSSATALGLGGVQLSAQEMQFMQVSGGGRWILIAALCSVPSLAATCPDSSCYVASLLCMQTLNEDLSKFNNFFIDRGGRSCAL